MAAGDEPMTTFTPTQSEVSAASATAVPRTSRVMLWSGRALTGLFTAFMVFDAGIKLVRLPIVAQTLEQLGYPGRLGFGIGLMEAAFLVLHLLPRTAVLGALLMTGVLGGAVASHLRLSDPLFSHTLFGVYLGVMMWGGLWLRDAGVRAILPVRR